MNGLTTINSKYSTEETTDRIIALLKEKEFHIFAKIDHQENAAKHEIELRPTSLIIFGNPSVGTLLMQEQQTIGIDLPAKFLVWENKSGDTKITYNQSDYLAERHGLSSDAQKPITALKNTIESVGKEAAGH